MTDDVKTPYLDIKDVDQEALQADYEVGVLSLRELSTKHGMCPKKGHVQITRMAKRLGWTQDLNAKIQAKAEAKLSSAVAAAAANIPAAPKKADAAIIEANAEAIMRVRSRHRVDINRASNLTIKLMEELELETDNIELLKQVGELLRSEDQNGNDKLNDLYHKVISNPGRIKSMKDLAETMKSLIGLEREAYNIGAVEDKPSEAEKTGRVLTDAERATRMAILIASAQKAANATVG